MAFLRNTCDLQQQKILEGGCGLDMTTDQRDGVPGWTTLRALQRGGIGAAPSAVTPGSVSLHTEAGPWGHSSWRDTYFSKGSPDDSDATLS